MAPQFLIPATNGKLYLYEPGGSFVEFSPQIPVGIGSTVAGSLNGEIWARKRDTAPFPFYYFDGTAWVADGYASASSGPARHMVGYDANHTYLSVGTDIYERAGGVWSVKSTNNAEYLAVISPTDIWANGGGPALWHWNGVAWTDEWNNLKTDFGGDPGGMVALTLVAGTPVVGVGPPSAATARMLKYVEGHWSQIGGSLPFVAPPFGCMIQSIWGSDLDHIWCAGVVPSSGIDSCFYWNGVTWAISINFKAVGGDQAEYGTGHMQLAGLSGAAGPDSQVLMRTGKWTNEQPKAWLTLNGGTTWSNLSAQWIAEVGIHVYPCCVTEFSPAQGIGPIIINEDPAPNEKFVPIDHNLVSFYVIDESSGVILNTLDAYIDGYWAFKNGTFQYPFDGPESNFDAIVADGYNGYSFVFDYKNAWEANKQIDLGVIAEDTLHFISDITWWFKTPENFPPVVINQDPAINETKVSISKSLIEFDIISTKTKVLPETIDAYVNGNLAFSSETFLSPFDGPSKSYTYTTDGYKIILDYTSIPWESYETVYLQVIAKDAYGFTADENWSFRIEDSTPPLYAGRSPLPEVVAEKNTLINIKVYSKYSGVDPLSINAYVNGIHAYDGSTDTFNHLFAGPHSEVIPTLVDGYDGYRVVINKIDPYQSGSRVTVEIYATNNEGI